MSANTTSSRNSFTSKLSSKAKRDALVSAQIANHIAAQIFNLRRDRGWTQAQLAKETGMGQSRVSLLEDSDYDAISLRTLKRFASAFGVALRVELVSFGEFLTWAGAMSPQDVRIPAFEDDPVCAAMLEPTPETTTAGKEKRPDDAASVARRAIEWARATEEHQKVSGAFLRSPVTESKPSEIKHPTIRQQLGAEVARQKVVESSLSMAPA